MPADAEGRYLVEPKDPGLTPDRLYDRAWAIGLLEKPCSRPALPHGASGSRSQAERFDVLQGVLEGDRTVPYAALATRLGTTEAALQATVSRLRKRYRAILREQVAATLDAPTKDEIDAEIGELFATLGD